MRKKVLIVGYGYVRSRQTSCAFVFYLVYAEAYKFEAYELVYQQGVVSALLTVSETSQRPRFVSSAIFYSDNKGSVVDESSAIASKSFSKQFLNFGEVFVHENSRLWVVIWFFGTYGSGKP